jgi:hypothetical protein
MTLPIGLVKAIAIAVEHQGGDMDDVDDLVKTWERLGREQGPRADRMKAAAGAVEDWRRGMSATATVTPNDSTPVGSDVTCLACQELERWHWQDWSRKRGEGALTGAHCTTCHSDHHHACVVCGACLPDDHRWDRFYCGSTCRVKGKHEREREELERVAWETEHPEEAAKQRAEREKWEAEIRELGAALNPPKKRAHRERIADLKAKAERCASCNEPFGSGDVIYRCGGIDRPVLPYCREHACQQWDGCHNKDAPEGRVFTNCRCLDDEEGQRHWLKPEPCAGCGRLVANDKDTANPRRFTRDWTHWGDEKTPQPRTFCSENCRRRVVDYEAKAKRQAARGDLTRRCESCHEEFTPTRSDARYCSGACRQRSHRQRQRETA